MTKRIFFVLSLAFVAFSLTACVSRYHSNTYDESNSYDDVFEGERVPQDVQ